MVFSNYNVPSLFESTDGGVTFTDISGNLEEFPDGSGSGPSVRWAEIAPTQNGKLYLVGTTTGLYTTSTTNGSFTTWNKESDALIGNAVIPMMDYRLSDGRLAIATHGNGVFTTTIPNHRPVEIAEPEPSLVLLDAFPNPFVNSSTIRFTIPRDGLVRVDVYSLKGELVNTILWATQYAGMNEVVWNGTNATGAIQVNSVYAYQIRYEDEVLTGKLLLSR